MILKIESATGFAGRRMGMIVCSCHAVSDREIHRAVASGRSLDEVVQLTGVTTDCGCCGEAVERIVSAARPCRTAPCAGCPNASPAAAGLAA
jgi:bacterioferritin-associated ferredoxin